MSRAWKKVALALVAALLYAQAPEGKRLSVYTAQTGYVLPVVDHGSNEYVGLFEVLEPMGPTSARVDKKRWRLKFRGTDSEFEEGKARARIAGENFDLGDRFFVENNRGFVPLRSLPALLTTLTGTPADLHMPARRLFIGATPVRYSAQLQKGAAPKLVLSFSSPVNPFIATEPGAVRLVFSREPVVSTGTDQLGLGGTVFSSANFAEENGAAQLTVHVTNPVIATFSDANRTITLSPVPAPAPQVAQEPTAVPSPATSPTTVGPPGTQAVRRPGFFILIDPAHGGSDRGAALSDSLAEKDAVLTLARRLRAEFDARGIPARLMRDGDADIATDRRAIVANTSRAAAVIFIHASTVGNGAHISTAALMATATGANTWNSAQSRAIPVSREWADAVAGEVLKRNIGALRLRASVPPLNETAVPAFVLEFTPPPSGQADSILSSSYVQAITSAVADATGAERARLEQGVR
jgi:N-acetylmuramoyl-L-alanine amidase